MGIGKGYGKTILFGEHFVVYGLPAIASALGTYTTANVKVIEGNGWGSTTALEAQALHVDAVDLSPNKEFIERLLKCAEGIPRTMVINSFDARFVLHTLKELKQKNEDINTLVQTRVLGSKSK